MATQQQHTSTSKCRSQACITHASTLLSMMLYSISPGAQFYSSFYCLHLVRYIPILQKSKGIHHCHWSQLTYTWHH